MTGGAGYIGSVCDALKATNAKVTIFDNIDRVFREHSPWHLSNSGFERLGCRGPTSALQPHAVIHFAGSIVVPESVKDPINYYKNNTANTLHLLQSCVAHGVSHVLFSSTAAVYGIPSTGICSEDDPLQPINPYGRSKLMTELMLHDIALASNLNYVALRYFNVAGAHANNHGPTHAQCHAFN